MGKSNRHHKYTLCTYTYNDQSLLHGLLKSIRFWQLPPDEVIVIDDHSESPLLPLSVAAVDSLVHVRNDENLGPTRTKERAVNMARSPYIISLDCDVRLDKNWTASVLDTLAKSESIGLCSSQMLHDSGKDAISRYLAMYGSAKGHGEASFIPGAAWAIKKAVWEDIGGFSGYSPRTHEDIELCKRLTEKGYTLYKVEVAQFRHMRRHSIAGVIRRHWQWNMVLFCRNSVNDPHAFATMLIGNANKRIVDGVSRGEFLFAYIELTFMLYSIAALFDLVNDQKAKQDFVRFYSARLSMYPRLLACLEEDTSQSLSASGTAHLHAHPFWSKQLAVLDRLQHSGVLDWIETKGISILMQEKERCKTDFSFHLQNM